MKEKIRIRATATLPVKTTLKKGMELLLERFGPFTVKKVTDTINGTEVQLVVNKDKDPELTEEFAKAMSKPDDGLGIDIISPDANRRPFAGRRSVR